MNASSPIDPTAFANLVEMTGGDLAFVDDLVDTYLEDGSAQVDALRDAVARSAVEDLVRPAHSLKSSSLNVGALQLGELCRTLENAARSSSVPHPAEWVAQIAAAFDVASRALLDERKRRAQG